MLGDIELADEVTQTTDTTATTDMGEEAAAEGPMEPAAPAIAPRTMMVTTVFAEDPQAPIFAGLLIAGMLVMAIAGAATAAMTMDVWPDYLDMLYQNLWMFAGATVVAGGLFALIGWLIGRQPAPRAAKPKKPAKEKKAKAAPAAG